MRASSPRQIVFRASLLVLVATILFGCAKKEEVAKDFVVFDGTAACAILVPEQATEGELRAARLIQGTLAKAARRPRDDFAVVRQAPSDGPVITLRGLAESTGQKLEEWVSCRVELNRVEITSYPADAIEAAAAWFLENHTGARWFMPGALGEHIPHKAELRLPFGQTSRRPSYISRHLGLGGPKLNAEWWSRNRLRRWFNHTHAMSSLFTPDDLRANPAFVPLVNGQRFVPATDHEGNWQPNIASEAAAIHAAKVLRRRPEFSSAIGMNDSLRYDQSDATRQWLGEPKWFRLRPDFSPLEFRFVNEVARRLPERYLGAYAYYWSEDAPPFRLEKNVVPYLTADRSEWFDPKFAEADKALMKRWVAAGPEVVGIYDYYYGAPYLVPRPTLYAVTQSIPSAHEAGVRAFYAEVYPNWALDGPKAWLAAQLLWDVSVKPEDLLDTYYAEFWREAAGPMREFYAACDEQWLNQPRPSYWIKYYEDEHQYRLFPAEVRVKLRRLLDQAMAGATTELTRNRLRFVSAGFAVTEVYCQWNETRDRLSRAALPPEIDAGELRKLQEAYTDEWEQVQARLAQVKQQYPLAISATLLPEYTRNDPRKRAGVRLATSEHSASGAMRLDSRELLVDPALAQVEIGPTTGFFDLEWVKRGAWRGHGEPYETRRVSLVQGAKSEGQSRMGEATGIRFVGCKQETFSQMVRAQPGKRYVARVRVQGKVSPGNATFLILNFQDAKGRALGYGAVDRLPVGEWRRGAVAPAAAKPTAGSSSRTATGEVDGRPWAVDGGRRATDGGEQRAEDVRLRHGGLRRDSSGRIASGEVDGTVELITWAEAPAEAVWVGLGVRALNQVGPTSPDGSEGHGEDYAEFSEFSLKEMDAGGR